jgi:membrane-bound ClpP family serine protease
METGYRQIRLLPVRVVMSKYINGRLITAIISGLIEEATVAIIVLWGLPAIGVELTLWGSVVLLVVLMSGWGTWSVIAYRKGSRALRSEPLVGLPDMLGARGKVVSPLVPEGLVKIKGELWVAKSEKGEINAGGEVTVVGQDRLKLVVRQNDTLVK